MEETSGRKLKILFVSTTKLLDCLTSQTFYYRQKTLYTIDYFSTVVVFYQLTPVVRTSWNL